MDKELAKLARKLVAMREMAVDPVKIAELEQQLEMAGIKVPEEKIMEPKSEEEVMHSLPKKRGRPVKATAERKGLVTA